MATLVVQLADLFRTERDRLLRRVRLVTRGSHEAEDIVQTVFLNLLSRDLSRDIAQPEHYLSRAATNAALDHLRQARRRAAEITGHPEVLAALGDPAPGVEACVQSRQELQILAHAVAALPPKCRVAFLLSRTHGLSMREIAVRMQVSEKTVEKHILKAILRCRSALRAAGRDF